MLENVPDNWLDDSKSQLFTSLHGLYHLMIQLPVHVLCWLNQSWKCNRTKVSKKLSFSFSNYNVDVLIQILLLYPVYYLCISSSRNNTFLKVRLRCSKENRCLQIIFGTIRQKKSFGHRSLVALCQWSLSYTNAGFCTKRLCTYWNVIKRSCFIYVICIRKNELYRYR